MIDLVIAISVLFALAVGLTAVWWTWLSRSVIRKIDAASRRLKIDLIENQSANLEQIVEQLKLLPQPVELDIAPLADRLLKLEKAVAANARLAADQQQALQKKLDKLTESVEDIPYPLGPKPVNLAPVYDRFQSIDAQLASLGKMIDRAASGDRSRAGR